MSFIVFVNNSNATAFHCPETDNINVFQLTIEFWNFGRTMSNSRQSRNALSADDLAKEIIKFGQCKDFDKLQDLVANSDTKMVSCCYSKENSKLFQ